MGDRIVTWPNALSAARLAGVPVFLWLVLGPRTATSDLIAAGILGLAGITDWLDGKLARMLNQQSKLGALLVQDFADPPTLTAVNEIEELTSGLSRKIWQKIIILDRLLGLESRGLG